MFRSMLMSFFFLAATAATASAHPGHGLQPSGPFHYLRDHGLGVGLAAVGVGLGVWSLRRSRRRGRERR